MKREKNAYIFRKLNNTNIQNTLFFQFFKLYALKKKKYTQNKKTYAPSPEPKEEGAEGLAPLLLGAGGLTASRGIAPIY